MPRHPGRTSATTFRAVLERSLAFSRTFNPRNIEYEWYATWNQALIDLIGDTPNLMVAPQYPLWYVHEDEELYEEPEDGDDLDFDSDVLEPGEVLEDAQAVVNRSDLPGFPLMKPPGLDDDDNGALGDTSFSTAATLPGRDTSSRITDFAILHVTADNVQGRGNDTRYGGWRIRTQTAPLIVEVKRYPSRSLSSSQLAAELDGKLFEAQTDLGLQAKCLFMKYPQVESVMAIAASGPYWNHAIIARESVLTKEESQRALKDPDYFPPERPPRDVDWSVPLLLDTAKSNTRFQTIFKALRAMHLMSVP